MYLIILTLIQPPQIPPINQINDPTIRHILRPHPGLLEPRRNGAHSNHKLLRHLIHMVVIRIIRPGRRIEITRRQRPLDVRRPQRTQEAAVLGPEPVQLRPDRQRRVAHDRPPVRVQHEAVGWRVGVPCAGVAGGRPFPEELVRAQRPEARVRGELG